MIQSQIEERFLDKVVRHGSCWFWTNRRNRQGYGMFWNGTTMALAHRVSYQLFCGKIPDGLLVLHKCDNPPCCNPVHLSVGTQQQNMDDMKAKGRSHAWMTQAIEEEVKLLQDQGVTQRSIAARFGVQPGTVQRVLPVGGAKGERNRTAKLVSDQVRQVRRRALRGESVAVLAEEYGVTTGAIYKITTGRTWSHLPWLSLADIQAALSDDVKPLFGV